jgi:hypothetical protein
MVTMGYILYHAEGFFKMFIFTYFLRKKHSTNDPKMTFLHKVWGPFFLTPPTAMFMVLNGSYGSCLEARLRDLISFAFLALFLVVEGVKKWIFFNCSISQNVLLFFQKNN